MPIAFEKSPRVLIVDDRNDKLVALKAVLADMGLEIVTAVSGRDALKQLLKQEFAVILLDVQMPGMDGFETASLIRQRKNLEHTPIIFITAYGDDMHVARGYSLGAVDFILAPVVPEILRTKVLVFIDLYRKNAELELHARQWQWRATQLHKLNQASLAINSALGMDELLRLVADRAVDIFSARRVAIVATVGLGRPQTYKVVAPRPAGDHHDPCEPNLLELEWLLSQDLCAVTTIAGGEHLVRYLRFEMLERELESGLSPRLLVAPLVGRGGAKIGVMTLLAHGDPALAADEEALLLQLAQTVSIAIENTLFADAREANRLKDEFLATLSHELRTPLTAMLGWVQLLRMQSLSPDETEHGLQVLERNVDAQTKLIDDLLDVSRIVTGKMRVNLRHVDLRAPVHAAVEAIAPQAHGKQLALGAALGDEPVMVDGDPDRLQQVVWNLLNNAVKFTPSGGRIDVQLRRVGGLVELVVSDTGQGINPQFLPHVFDRFRQADSTTTRAHGGLGIGLALVSHVVQLHGGNVRAESGGEGQGTCVTVALPLVANALATAEPNSPAMVAAAPLDCRQVLHGARILVVDDQADTRDVLTKTLNGFGARAIGVGSASAVLAALEGQEFDLLVSDIGLPEMDGCALIRYLRRQAKPPAASIPAIAVTAFAHADDKQRALSAGYNAYLAKPVQIEQLAQLAASLVKREHPDVLADARFDAATAAASPPVS